jgi:vtaA11
MNKTFKVIWNKATQSMVVVSELAKSVSGTKSTRTSNVLKLSAVAGALLIATSANAKVSLGNIDPNDVGAGTIAVGDGGTTAKGGNGQVIGTNNTIPNGNNTVVGNNIKNNLDTSVILGNNAGTVGADRGSRHILIGAYAQVGQKGVANSQSIAIGGGWRTNDTLDPNLLGGSLTEGAWARGDQSVAIGGNVVAYGNSSVAIGGDDTNKAAGVITTYINPDNGQETTGTVQTAFNKLTGVNMQNPRYRNTQSGEASVALGAKTFAGDLSLALGPVATAEKTNTVAIGSASHAKYANSVAIGGGSITDKEGRAYTSETILGKTYTWAGGAQTIAGDVVSFGQRGYERQLINIAPGEVSETSTDAINGSQLFSVMNSLERGPIIFKGNDNKVYYNLDTGLNDTVAGANKKEGTGNRLNTTVEIVGGASNSDETSASNLKTVVTDGKVEIQMKTKPEFKGTTLKDGNNIVDLTPTADGLKLANGTNNVKISGVANGTTAGDAVNFEQLDALKNSPLTFAGNTGNIVKRLGETLKIYGTDITTNAGANGIELTLNKGGVTSGETKAVSGGDVFDAINTAKNSIVLNTKAGSTTGSVNLADKSLTFVSSDLDITTANENVNLGLSTAIKDKINSIDTKISDNKIKLTGDDGSTDEVALSNNGGINFDIKGGATQANSGGYALTENNIGVEKTTTGVKLKLAPVLKNMKNISLLGDDGFSTTELDANNGLKLLNGTDGSIVKLNYDGLDNGGHKITNVGEGAVSKTSTDAVNGSQLFKIKEDIEKSQYKGWKVNTDKVTGGENTGSASTDVASTDEVKFIAGKNIKIAQNGKDLTFSTTDEISASKVKVGDVELGTDGINAGNKVIKNVADGNVAANSKEAVNGGQLFDAKKEVKDDLMDVIAKKKFGLTDDDGNAVTQNLDNTIGVIGDNTNIQTEVSGNNIAVKLKKDLNLDSVTTGNTKVNSDGIKITDVGKTVSLTYDGLDNGGNKITNVDKGDIKKNGTDAVNAGQLYDLKEIVNQNEAKAYKGFNVNSGKTTGEVSGSAKTKVNSDDEVKFFAGKNIKIGQNGTEFTFSTTDELVADKVTVGDVNIGSTGINAGNKKIADVANGLVAKDSKEAVNGGQLFELNEKIKNISTSANAGFNVTTDSVDGGEVTGTTVENVSPSETVKFTAGKNIKIEQKGKEIVVATSDNLKVTTITAGDTVVSDDGITISTGPALTKNGLNMGGKKVTNVADGEISENSKDAVNGSQIYALAGDQKNVVTQNEFVNNKGQKVTTTNKVVTDKDGNALLKTYNVEGNTEIVSNNVIEAINNMNEQGIKFFHSNDGVKRTPKAEDTNDFDSSATGKYATAIGAKTKVNGDQSSGLGVGNTINANDSVAVGNSNTINKQKSGTYGSGNTINGENSYAVGNDNTIESSNTVVVGNNVKSTADNSVILGNNSGYSKASKRTAGNGALTSQTLNGKERHFAGGAANEVVGVVSVGNTTVDPNGKETVQTRRIQNVAPGLISKDSTDAINGSQLYAMMNESRGDLDKLKGQVNKMGKRHRAGLAGVNAATTLPQVFMPGKSMISAGAGHYKGQNAIAVGYSRAADSGKLIFKLQGNVNTQGEFGAGAGIGYQW